MSTLKTAWIVGEVKWRDDWAMVQVARTKTAARKLAERRLAKDEYDLIRGVPELRNQHQRDAKRCRWPFDRYVEWVASLFGCTSSIPARAYIRRRDGITLTGPKGEKVHIAEPSQKARRERLGLERESAAYLDQMCKAIVTGLKRERE